MNGYKRTLLLVVALLVLTACPAGAQDDFTPEEEALTEYVAAAIEDTLAQNSISATLDMEMLMNMVFVTGSDTTNLTMEMTAGGEIKNAIDEEQNVSSTAEITMEMSISMPGTSAQEGAVDISVIQLGSDGYARFSNAAGVFTDALPETDWISLDLEDPTSLVDVESLLAYRDIGLQYPVTVETIVAIKELEPETLDDQAMRTFEMTFDMPAIMEMSEEMLVNMLGTSGLGQDDALLEALVETMTLDLALWVGDEDGLVHYAQPTITVETELTAAQTGSIPADVTLEMVQEITYSAFGEPVEIVAPDM
jgi:hypothetical protein